MRLPQRFVTGGLRPLIRRTKPGLELDVNEDVVLIKPNGDRVALKDIGGGNGGSQPALEWGEWRSTAPGGFVSITSGALNAQRLIWDDFVSGSAGGEAMLDLTDPVNPVIVEDGWYEFAMWFGCQDGTQTGEAYGEFVAGDFGDVGTDFSLASANTSGASTTLPLPAIYLEAGDVIYIIVRHNNGSPLNFAIAGAWVSKVAAA